MPGKPRVNIDDVKEKVIDYLKDNGSANMSELCRVIGCGRQTIYNAVQDLEDEGIVKSELVHNRRVVVIVGGVPVYLVYTTLFTIFIAVLYIVGKLMNIQLILSVVYTVISMLYGFWVGIIILRMEDVRESINLVKSTYKRLFRETKVCNLIKRK